MHLCKGKFVIILKINVKVSGTWTMISGNVFLVFIQFFFAISGYTTFTCNLPLQGNAQIYLIHGMVSGLTQHQKVQKCATFPKPVRAVCTALYGTVLYEKIVGLAAGDYNPSFPIFTQTRVRAKLKMNLISCITGNS